MGSTQAAGAAAVVRDGEGQSVRWGPAGIIRVLASARSTDDSFSIVEVTEPPGSATPLHTHHGEAEAFYVVDGEIELTCGDETVKARKGDFVYTPKDVAHKYAVIGDRKARVLMLFTRPGFEEFFLEGGSPLDKPPAGPPDPQAMKRLVEKYGMELNEIPSH